MEFAGVPRGAIEGLPGSAREAGLDIAEADGFFCTQDPEIGFEIHAGSLAAARERACWIERRSLSRTGLAMAGGGYLSGLRAPPAGEAGAS